MEPSLEAEPKVPPEPDTGAKKNAERTAPELAILKGAADDPARMVAVVMSIKGDGGREQAGSSRRGRAAATPPAGRRRRGRGGAAASSGLDRLSGVWRRRGAREPVVLRRARALRGRRAGGARRAALEEELDAIMTGERAACRRLRRTPARWRGAPRRSTFLRERRRRAARDARCAAWLAARLPARAAALEALCGLLEQHRALERSWTFQRALFFEQLRLTGATGGEGRHDREALSFGTTSFAAFCSILAAPCLKDARTRGGACVVLGSSTGTLCFYAAALGFEVKGVDVMEPSVAVARSLAITHHEIGVDAGAFRVLDVRDPDIGRIVRGATLVIVASSCWGPGSRCLRGSSRLARLGRDGRRLARTSTTGPLLKGEVRVAVWGSACPAAPAVVS